MQFLPQLKLAIQLSESMFIYCICWTIQVEFCFFILFFLNARSPQTRLKATLDKGYKKKNINVENNSGELKVRIDILWTV